MAWKQIAQLIRRVESRKCYIVYMRKGQLPFESNCPFTYIK